jgi:hypothetical protein
MGSPWSISQPDRTGRRRKRSGVCTNYKTPFMVSIPMPAMGKCIRCSKMTKLPPDNSKGLWLPMNVAKAEFLCPECQKRSL